MRFPLLLSAAGLALASYAFADTKTYNVREFNGLDVSRVIDVVYTQGPEFSVTADIPTGDFDELDLRVDDGMLVLTRPTRGRGYNTRISERNGERVIKVNGRKVPPITVYVTAPGVSSFDLSSSSTLVGTGVNVPELYTEVTSSARMTLSGRCGTLRHEAGSSGKLEAAELSCGYGDIDIGSSSRSVVGTLSEGLKVEASSSADLTATVSGGDVDVDASSSADVVLSGTCGKLVADTSSSADLKARNLSCERVEAEASSGSDIRVGAASYVSAEANSGADIDIYGQPGSLQKSEGSGGDVSIIAAL